MPKLSTWILSVLLSVIAEFGLAQTPESLVVRWEFESEETSRLRSVGTVHRDVPGPRSPLYPDFDTNNTAIQLDGSGGHLEFDDPGTKSNFDFDNEDPISAINPLRQPRRRLAIIAKPSRIAFYGVDRSF